MRNKIPLHSDLEAISAYLDGEATSKEEQLFDERLQYDEAFRELFHQLSRTRTLLRTQPNLHAPRNYTLKQQWIEQRKTILEIFNNRNKFFQTASAILSLVFGIWFCLNILTVNQQKGLLMSPAPAEVFESAPMAPYPAVITTETSISVGVAGISTNEPMMKAAPINPTNEATSYPNIVGAMGLEGVEITTTQSITESALMKSFPKGSETPMVSAQNLDVATSVAQEETGALPAYPAQFVDQSQTSLISPQAESGSMQNQTKIYWVLFQIGLAFLAVLFGGLTFYFYKHHG